jgi:hypothetical protein
MGALSLFLVIAGGTAYAANTIGSSDIINESILSRDIKNNEVATLDVENNQIRTGDIRDDTLAGGGLTGTDIADQSGVDTCVLTTRLGQLCVRGENQVRSWTQAVQHCGNLDLRVPTVGEAVELAKTHDIPNVDDTEPFWTDATYQAPDNTFVAIAVDDNGNLLTQFRAASLETVCVTTPTN